MKSVVFMNRQHKCTKSEAAVSKIVNVLGILAISLACAATLGLTTPTNARENDVTVLLRQQTELFADAGQRGDQATMNRLLDDEALFSGGSGTVDTMNPDAKRDHPDRMSALLKMKTLALLSAGAPEYRAFMQQSTDPNAVLVNENGSVSNPHDFANTLPPAIPREASLKISFTDWVLHCASDVAVTSFTETRCINLNGQTLAYQSLFVNVWINRGNAWKLIGSQSIPLHRDLSALPLPVKVLDEYVGRYIAAPGLTVTLSRDGTTLFSSVNGAKPTAMLAVARDVLSRSGVPTGYVRPQITFQRDASGRITGYVSRSPGLGNIAYVKDETTTPQGNVQTPPMTVTPGDLKVRDFVVHRFGDAAVVTFLHDRNTKIGGQTARTTYRSSESWIERGNIWKMISSQGCELPSDPPEIALTSKALDDYIGTYQAGPHSSVAVRRAGTTLTVSSQGRAMKTLDAQAPDIFFVPGATLEAFLFQRNANGQVTGCVSRYAERDLVLTKVSS